MLALALASALVAACSGTPTRPAVQAGEYGGGGSAAAVPTAPSDTDQMLANRVYAALNADPVYFFRHVDVRVTDGVAHLTGYVWTADAIYRARQIARGVPGVTRVVTNNLELEREGRSGGSGPTR